MKKLLSNLSLTAHTISEHVADDPVLLFLQVSRRMNARMVKTLSRQALKLPKYGALEIPQLLASVASGDEAMTRDRLCASLDVSPQSSRRLSALADIAVVAGLVDMAREIRASDRTGMISGPSRARLLWYEGDVTGAVNVASTLTSRSGRRQFSRLFAEQRILQGWAPKLPKSPVVPCENRVLHVLTNSLPHTSSGYAQRSHSILLAQKNAGFEPLAVTRIGYPVQVGKLMAAHIDVVDGIEYRRLLPGKLAATVDKRLQQQAELLLDLVLEYRPAILHTTTHYVNALVVRSVAEAVGIPWVYEVRGQLADTWAAARGPEALTSERYGLFKAREADAVRGADLILTLGESMRANIEKDSPTAAVLLAPNAVGEKYLDEPDTQSAARAKLGLRQAGRYVGTVSSLVDYEGIDDLVKAYGLLVPSNPDLTLLIVGDGTARPSLEALVESMGFRERVIFAGRVPRHKAAMFHQALDVFVVPRKDLAVTRDVTPLKPVEALASARPVVATSLPALCEIVDDGVNGLLVEPGDIQGLAAAIQSLVRNPEQCKAMGRAGRKKVLETRTWHANTNLITRAYGDVIRES